MILDERTEFLAATNVFAAAGSNLVGDVIDLTAIHRDIGMGQPLWWHILVTIAFVGATSTTDFQIRTDAAAAINATTGTLHVSTGPIAVAALVIEKRFMIPLPVEGNVYERFMGLVVVGAVATTTAGAITSGLTLDPVGWAAYPDALTNF